MQEGYKLNCSNTFYRVWGILVLVFGGIAVLIKFFTYLFQLIFMSETELFYLIPYDIEEMMIAIYIFCFVFLAVEVETKLMTGIILVNDYVKSKGACVCYAVFYFIAAALWMFALIFYIIMMVEAEEAAIALLILYCIIKIGWDITIGVILLNKMSKATIPISGGGIEIDTRTVIRNEVPIVGAIDGLNGEYAGRRFSLHAGETCRIGRDSGCNIRLRHEKVSRMHCSVTIMPDGRYQILDSSSNGTYYNNSMLQRGIATVVDRGGLLVVGAPDNVFQLQ